MVMYLSRLVTIVFVSDYIRCLFAQRFESVVLNPENDAFYPTFLTLFFSCEYGILHALHLCALILHGIKATIDESHGYYIFLPDPLVGSLAK